MSLNDIFSARLLDHSKYPRRHTVIQEADITLDSANPLCGDEITVQVKCDGDNVTDAAIQTKACAICTAACSMFAERAAGSSVEELDRLHTLVDKMLHHKGLTDAEREELGDMIALEGVSQLPSRVKCAALVWETWGLIANKIREGLNN